MHILLHHLLNNEVKWWVYNDHNVQGVTTISHDICNNVNTPVIAAGDNITSTANTTIVC